MCLVLLEDGGVQAIGACGCKGYEISRCRCLSDRENPVIDSGGDEHWSEDVSCGFVMRLFTECVIGVPLCIAVRVNAVAGRGVNDETSRGGVWYLPLFPNGCEVFCGLCHKFRALRCY